MAVPGDRSIGNSVFVLTRATSRGIVIWSGLTK